MLAAGRFLWLRNANLQWQFTEREREREEEGGRVKQSFKVRFGWNHLQHRQFISGRGISESDCPCKAKVEDCRLLLDSGHGVTREMSLFNGAVNGKQYVASVVGAWNRGMEHWWNYSDTGKPKQLGEKTVQALRPQKVPHWLAVMDPRNLVLKPSCLVQGSEYDVWTGMINILSRKLTRLAMSV